MKFYLLKLLFLFLLAGVAKLVCSDVVSRTVTKGHNSRQLYSFIKPCGSAMAHKNLPLDFKASATVCEPKLTSGNSCSTSSGVMSPQIKVEPTGHLLIDESLEIKIDNLAQNQKVTVYAYMSEEGKKFESCGCFKADTDGRLNLSRQASLSGTYKGKLEMLQLAKPWLRIHIVFLKSSYFIFSK